MFALNRLLLLIPAVLGVHLPSALSSTSAIPIDPAMRTFGTARKSVTLVPHKEMIMFNYFDMFIYFLLIHDFQLRVVGYQKNCNLNSHNHC